MKKETSNYQQTLQKPLSGVPGLHRLNLIKFAVPGKSWLNLIGHIGIFLTWWILIALNDYLFWEEALLCSAIIFSLLFFRAVEQNDPFRPLN